MENIHEILKEYELEVPADKNCYNNGQLADMYIYSRVKIGE